MAFSFFEKNEKLKRSEEQLKKIKMEYQGIFENHHAIMLIINPETGDIIQANLAAINFYGWSQKELMNMRITDINILSKEEVKARMQLARSKNKTHFLFKHQLSDGTIKDVEVHSGSIMREGKKMLFSIINDITERSQAEKTIKHLAYFDSLTALPNRKMFSDKLNHAIFKAKENNLKFALLYIDLDYFKDVNDSFGHLIGDQLLIKVAERLKKNLRKDSKIFRLGGDEFAIIMPNTNHKEVENRVKDMIESCKNYNVKAVKLSVSFGFKTKVDSSVAFDEVYKSAEDSMYRMKLLDVPSMRSNTIDTIIRTLYETDQYSEEHSRSVSKICEAIAIKHHLPFQQINEIKMAGVLHDIGKIVISKKIINKNGELTKKEYDEIKSHSEIGFRILNSSTELRQLSTTVLSHHEHWDGKGYPQNLKGEQIPLLSRIISVADAFDAMTSDRTYREKISPSNAILEINRCSGTQFDPKVVKTFTENFDAILELSKTKIYEQ
jgi:diguanylate cyclase (GGDEF)-like protein/PAS domain S-box-containing protein